MVLVDTIMYQEMIGTGKTILLTLTRGLGLQLPLIPGHIPCLIIMPFLVLIGIPYFLTIVIINFVQGKLHRRSLKTQIQTTLLSFWPDQVICLFSVK